MWDTKTLKLIKTIDGLKCRPDGILADPFNQRIYVFNHPTMDATVIDAKDGTVLSTIDLGRAERAVSDEKSRLRCHQDKSNVAVIDAKTMKVTRITITATRAAAVTDGTDAKNHVISRRADNPAHHRPPRPSP